MFQSQLRIYMSNYLKNQGTWKLSQLKNLKFEEIKEEFDKLVKQIDTFVPINLEATKVKLKRYGEKSLRTIDSQKKTRIQKRLKRNPVEDMNPTPFTTKSNVWVQLEDISARLVMQKYGTNRSEDAYDRVLWSDLKTMFDTPLNEDAIWSLPLQQKMMIEKASWDLESDEGISSLWGMVLER
ncbi:hypothetical protein Tco_1556020 [Tanacetum coccineum]